MSNVIKLDSAASDAAIRNLADAIGELSNGCEPSLSQADTDVGDTKYASIPGIGSALATARENAGKLEAFKEAFESYVGSIEDFDSDAAALIRGIPDYDIPESGSGWRADPKALEERIIDKLINDGLGRDAEHIRAILKDNWASLKGISKSSAYCGDPVNMSTGNFIYSKEDIAVAGARPLVFRRFYNAMDDAESALGLGWTHSFNIFLGERGGSALITFGDGRQEAYRRDDGGGYRPPDGIYNTLRKHGDGYTLTAKGKTEHRFTKDGKIREISDASGNATKFEYAGGMLAKVSSICGTLEFAYDDEKRLRKVADHTGRSAIYEYRDGCLARATQPGDAAYRYEYDADKRLRQITAPSGAVALVNEYGSDRRVASQTMADGGSLKMAYDNVSLSTVVTEQDGKSASYAHDSNCRTVKIARSGGEECYEYDRHGNRTAYKDRRGNSYRYSYDENGNMIEATDALRNVTRISWGAFSKPLQVINPDGSAVSFEYDAKGNLTGRTDPLGRTWRIAYDRHGWPTQETLPDGSVRKYAYDGRGNAVSVEGADGATTLYEYDELNRMTKRTDAAGNVTRFSYNLRGDVTESVDAAGNSCTFEYDAGGSLARAVDRCGNETRFTYDAMGRVESVTDALGGVSRYGYDSMGNMTWRSGPDGSATRYRYGDDNRLAEIKDPEGNSTRFEHDPNGNITAVVGPAGVRTEIEYDAMNRAVRQTEPDGAEIRHEYDCMGRLTATTYPGGVRETREYDKAGQLVSRTNLRGETTRYRYTALGRLEAIVSQDGDEMRYDYYPGGRLKSVTKPEGETERYVWDGAGNLVQRVDQFGNATKFAYDALGRVAEVRSPQGGKKTFAYDPMGRVTSMTDANGNTTRYRYSKAGTLVETVDALGSSTFYSYDAARRLSSVETAGAAESGSGGSEEPERRLTTYEYDRRGLVTAVRSPMGTEARYAYDADGRLISRRDEEGMETSFKYNLIGQLTETTYADGRQVLYRYGELRQLAEVQDWLGTTKIETTPFGQVTRVAFPDGKSVGYEWTELGQRRKTVYPDGSEVEYAYNASGRLSQVRAPGGVTAYLYDEAGRIARREMPGALVTEYGWDSLGRLAHMAHSQDGADLDEMSYSYDPMGNVVEIEKRRSGADGDSGTFRYSYDPLNRLVKSTHGGDVRSYAYDSFGNRVSSHDGDRETLYSYNALNQLIAQRCGEERKEYRYDRRGNLTDVFANGSVEARYSYDSAGALARASAPGTGVAEYCYDGLRNRVSKMVWRQGPEASSAGGPLGAAESTRYAVDMLKPYDNLLYMETGGGRGQSFIWGKDLLATAGDAPYSYLNDHLGSPMRLVREGAESAPLAYGEFGAPLLAAGQGAGNPFGFTGYQTDDISGLLYAQARHYDPLAGRMTSMDIMAGSPAMPQGLNRYAYCANNPVALVDRNGLWPWPSWSDILDKGAEMITRGVEKVAGFIDNTVDNVVDTVKRVVAPHVEAAVDYLNNYDPSAPITQPIVRFVANAIGEHFGLEKLANFGAGLLDMSPDDNGIFFADFNCWQRIFGYNDLYDEVFNLGTSMKREKFKFTCDGEEFVFWAWRADYLNLGAGAELGIYRKSGNLGNMEHWDAALDKAMPMTLRVLDVSGKRILGRYPEDPQWWITGFNYEEQLRDADELIAIYTMSMRDQKDMFRAFYDEWFYKSLRETDNLRLVLNPFIQMVTFTFMPEGRGNMCIC